MFEDKFKSNNLEREQEQFDCIVKEFGGKLIRWFVNSQCEFERRKLDGIMMLGFFYFVDFIVGELGYCFVRLGMIIGRFQFGVNILQGFKEDKRNKVILVLYLNYGFYSFYVLYYDFIFVNISKDDFDLIYLIYGEDFDFLSDFSIYEFLVMC